MANVLDSKIIVIQFELKMDSVHFQINTFGKGLNLLIPQAMS